MVDQKEKQIKNDKLSSTYSKLSSERIVKALSPSTDMVNVSLQQISPVVIKPSDIVDSDNKRSIRFFLSTKKYLIRLFMFIINLNWFIFEREKLDTRSFLHSKDRSKRQYINELLIHSSTYLAMAISFSILITMTLLYEWPSSDLYNAHTLVWYPDRILTFSYAFPFLSQTFQELLNMLLLAVFVPYFSAGIIAGFMWGNDAKDVIGVSALFSVLSFVFIYVNDYFLQLYFNVKYIVSAWAFSIIVMSYITIIILYSFFASIIGGSLGVIMGNLISLFSYKRKDSQIYFSPNLLPEIPPRAETIFDMVDVSNYEQHLKKQKVMMVLLNKTVEFSPKNKENDICPYFVNDRCAYLGYKTLGNKMQICLSGSHNFCRIYAFILQSKKITNAFKEEGVKN